MYISFRKGDQYNNTGCSQLKAVYSDNRLCENATSNTKYLQRDKCKIRGDRETCSLPYISQFFSAPFQLSELLCLIVMVPLRVFAHLMNATHVPD